MNLLFDLDGTLSDPAKGITKCIQYALEKLEVNPPGENDLHWCIGPPLQESFQELLPEGKKDKSDQALIYYRERFSEVGMYENTPYVGIENALSKLSQAGYNMYVATSKPHVYAKKILTHFKLDKYFLEIYGSELDGTNRVKFDLISHILKRESLDPKKTLMIGDREYDLIGAQKCKLKAIGVSYGYGSKEELNSQSPIFIADTPEILSNYICENFKNE
jgi:phosphoglycolate phosphatase